MDADAIFCNECGLAVDSSIRSVEVQEERMVRTTSPPGGASAGINSDGEPIAVRSTGAFDEELVAAVKARYKDGYRHAKGLDGAGSAIKALGVIVGILAVLIGISIGGSAASSAREFGPGAGAGIFVGLLVGVPGALTGAILFVIGILVSSAGQIMKAQLDSAVNSSPFVSDIDRAEMMSLPCARTATRESTEYSPVARELGRQVSKLGVRMRQ